MTLTTDPSDPRLGRGPGGAGLNAAYLVLSEEERAKGFVRPLRLSYIHHMPAPQHELRDLTAEERERYGEYGYVKFEAYPEAQHPTLGRFWTQDDLDRAVKGCGCVTTMAAAIAETYARDPGFYGATFCTACATHLPVGEIGEFTWIAEDGNDTGIKVGT